VIVAGVEPNPVSIVGDSCSNTILEPNVTCSVRLRFTPSTGGAVSDTLEVQSDTGTLSVPVTAVSPAVSSLVSDGPTYAQFKPFGPVTTTGRRQRLNLELTNPLSAPVRIGGAQISGVEAMRFRISADGCRQLVVGPGGECALSVLFTPARFGTARAMLTLTGDGLPLVVALNATASAPPRVDFLRTRGNGSCASPASRGTIVAGANRPAVLRWSVRSASDGRASACIPTGRSESAGATSASGKVATGDVPSFVDGTVAYVARLTLPRSGALRAGRYLLTVTASDSEGRGKPRTIRLRLSR
jgi:hypothetical protein